ncbi:MAG: glucokinase [Parcubacteria group bacterium Gr01-1014_20]|nr:MAG: glucokinase [Parcubacteria group bacterium Gr01-1014_20]
MYLLFDMGGTKMRVAVSKDGKDIAELRVEPTPQNFGDGIHQFGRMVSELTEGKKIKAAAGGVPGPFNRDRTQIANAANLPGWNNMPLMKELSKFIDAEIYLENDSAMAGLGEATFGAGKGKKIVAYITTGTGVGGARIINGGIDENSLGFEPGKQIIDCKNRKPLDLENLVSGRAIEKQFGKKPYEITDSKFWEKLAELLAYGVNNTIVHWSPDVVVLGGSMMKKVGISVPRVEFYLKKIHTAFPVLPLIRKASLGDFGGLYGGLAYLKNLKK